MYIVDRTCMCHLSFDGISVCMYVRSSDDDLHALQYLHDNS